MAWHFVAIPAADPLVAWSVDRPSTSAQIKPWEPCLLLLSLSFSVCRRRRKVVVFICLWRHRRLFKVIIISGGVGRRKQMRRRRRRTERQYRLATTAAKCHNLGKCWRHQRRCFIVLLWICEQVSNRSVCRLAIQVYATPAPPLLQQRLVGWSATAAVWKMIVQSRPVVVHCWLVSGGLTN